ncbi:MAG TPA: GH25 family lysozyme [Acidimicrobiales bacterium]|nr:GH25 family lysozyme [Acidimicrobiales bacterium]
MHYGVDISSNNPHPINWAAIAAWAKAQGGGAEPFAFIKISQGTGYVNSEAAGDVAGARASGIAVAGYLFDEGLAPVAGEEAVFKQYSFNLPQADDFEMPQGLTVQQYVQHAEALVAVDRSALEYLNQSEVTEGFPANALWLADYNDDPAQATFPCLVHQYSDVGTIPGISSEFDLNSWLGTEAQFDSYFHVSPPPPPHPSFPTWPGRVFQQPPIMTGSDVKTWQAQMAHRGFKLTVDGAYGPASEAICKQFQTQAHLTVDGMVGERTWSASWTVPIT